MLLLKIFKTITSPIFFCLIIEAKLFFSSNFTPSIESIISFSTIPALLAGEPGITASSDTVAPPFTKTP